ncbi:MAG TPA: type I restriction enzyme HsdR N-terminal domain-containing protein [Leptolyngbyaceae cyanobacterium]
MKTACINSECQQKYNVDPAMIGRIARCKRCNTIFTVEEYVEPSKGLDFILDDESSDNNQEEQEDSSDAEKSKRRRTSQEIINDRIHHIKQSVKESIPLMMQLIQNGANETETRHGIEVILKEALGYDLVSDIRKEHSIKGLKADYVVKIKEEDTIVIEAKKVGLCLKKSHVYQATNYGALVGLKWVVLTNGVVWQLYRITQGEQYDHHLIFTIDLLDGLSDEEAEFFYLISKDGMSRRNLLENRWQKILALGKQNLLNVLLSEEVIAKIRTTLAKETGYKATDEEVKTALEENLLQLS